MVLVEIFGSTVGKSLGGKQASHLPGSLRSDGVGESLVGREETL